VPFEQSVDHSRPVRWLGPDPDEDAPQLGASQSSTVRRTPSQLRQGYVHDAGANRGEGSIGGHADPVVSARAPGRPGRRPYPSTVNRGGTPLTRALRQHRPQ